MAPSKWETVNLLTFGLQICRRPHNLLEMKTCLFLFIFGLLLVQNQVISFRIPVEPTTPSPNEIKDQVIYVLPRSEWQATVLVNITSSYDEIVLWKPDSPENIQKNKEVHFFVNASIVEEIKSKLKESAITYTVLVQNAQELIDQQTYNDTTGQRSTVSFYEQYHSLEDIYYWMDQMVEKHSDMLERINIGNSYEKRPLYVLKLSAKSKTNTTNAIWIDCGIHAREWISPAFCLWFIGHAVGFYGVDQQMTKLLQYTDFYVLPVMNVDGYHYSWTTNRMWRKNRSKHPHSSCIGVDLNRNFDAGWCGPGASSNPCQETYCGLFPESEPEVAAVVDFIKQNQDIIKGYITIHSYSQMVLFPYSYKRDKSKDHDELAKLASKVTDGIKLTTRNKYVSGTGADTIYLAPGGSDDWAYDQGIKYSFTIELRDKGTYGFLLPPKFIRPTCSEALTGVKIISAYIVKKNVIAS
ncbi:carboxypeptidase B2 [Pyxicephalus adspersus]|uniref:carboxypeptidase B2 n=1 Tax=Pyxicephalus adspersus TaxID=30357 RepID=UPI003B58D467